MKVKSESEVVQLCPTLSDPMDCSLPGSSVHRIFQARVLEWVAVAFSVEESDVILITIFFFFFLTKYPMIFKHIQNSSHTIGWK